MDEELTLEDYLIQDCGPELFDPLTFIVNDDDEAQWALRNIKKAEAKLLAVANQANAESEKIHAWFNQATAPHQKTLDYFTNALKSYMLRQREDGRKSLTLPDGEVTSRSVPDRAEVSDKETFLKWAKENKPEWIRHKEEPDLSAIKGEVEFDGDVVIDKQTGEVIDGLVHIASQMSVAIKVSN